MKILINQVGDQTRMSLEAENDAERIYLNHAEILLNNQGIKPVRWPITHLPDSETGLMFVVENTK